MVFQKLKYQEVHWKHVLIYLNFCPQSTQGKIFTSKGEAKRMLDGGGVSINRQKINIQEWKGNPNLIQNRYLIIQKGKKNYFLVEVDS